jgi:hypothetical protein
MKLARTAFAFVLFAAFGLAACGNDDKLDAENTDQQAGNDSENSESEDSESDTTDTTDDSGDSGGGDSEDCGGIDLPAGYEGLLGAGGSGCEYLECLFDEMGVSNAEEFEEKFGSGDGAQPSPEAIGAITGALQKCGAILTPQS